MDDFIERLAQDVIDGKKTLLQIERHLIKQGWMRDDIVEALQDVQEAVSRRKKGNG
jgi:hypothetical protein